MVSQMEAPGPLREVRSWEEVEPDPHADAGVLEAMLLTLGERGYAETTVREVAERAGISQGRFHHRFGTKEACFARAHEEAAERLAKQVLEACREAPGWREGFRAGLTEVLQLAAALDSARSEPGARRGASPMTAGFIAGAIEESLSIEIAAGRAAGVEYLLNDLSHLAFLQLFGEE